MARDPATKPLCSLLRLTWRLQNSFHGRTFGAMALTTSKTYYRQGFAPLMPQVVVAPYPYCLHCKVRQAHPEGDSWYKASPTHAVIDCNGLHSDFWRCIPVNHAPTPILTWEMSSAASRMYRSALSHISWGLVRP